MTAGRGLWMLFGTFVLTTLFVCLFIIPNYRRASQASQDTVDLALRIEQIELRQAEVKKMQEDYDNLQSEVAKEYKHVPSTPDMSQIVQELSLDVDGQKVLDQSFTAGTPKGKSTNYGFAVQPLAVTLHADFESLFYVIKSAESMNRLVRVSSIRMVRNSADEEMDAPALEAAIGLHAMYDAMEVD